MTDLENKIWDLVNNWCDMQYHDTPEANKRHLMDMIYGLVENCNRLPVGNLLTCPNCDKELQLEIKEMTNSDLLNVLKDNNHKPPISECVDIMLHDCSPNGIKNKQDKYDVVDCNSGIILFTGTGEECKAKYPNYI